MTEPLIVSESDLRTLRRRFTTDEEFIQWVKRIARREAADIKRDHLKRSSHIEATAVADHNHTDAADDGGGMAAPIIDDYAEFTEAAAPGTPGTGLVRVYAKADGKLYIKDDAGTETDLTASGGSITVKEVDGTPSVSSVTTIRVSNGDLTDDGGGQVTIDTTGGGGGGTTWLEKAASGNGPGASLDDEFDDSTKTGWTETAVSGTATWTEDADVLSVIFNSQSASDAAFIAKTLTSFTTGDYIETAMRLWGVDSNWVIGGLILTDGTSASANSVAFSLQLASPSALVRRAGTVTNLGGTVDSSMGNIETDAHPVPWLYLRLTYVSANTFRGEVSIDGVTWTNFGAADITPTFTPTHGGLFVSSWGGTTVGRLATFEYFRTSVA